MSSSHHDVDVEGDSDRGDSVQPEDDDKGKGSSSTQVRKAQNRIAQREFRLRKQQYIRDLEARVEVLSGDKDERSELVMLLVRNLLKENKDLRNLVKSMAGFIGEGLGSCLPRLGLSAPGLDAILNRADTDTAYEAFINLKATREMQDANPGIPLGEIRRRTSTSASKRKRASMDVSQRDEFEPTPRDTETPEASSAGPSRSKENTAAPASSSKRAKEEGEGAPASSTSQQFTDNYAYLFPDLESYANPPRTETGAGWNFSASQPQNYFDPSARNLMTDPYERGYWPGLMSQGTFGGAPTPQANMTGFGVTVPASDFHQPQTMSSLAGAAAQPPNQASIASYAASYPAQPPTAATALSTPPALSTPDKSDLSDSDRQRHLRQAVAKMTRSQKTTTEGPTFTPAEVEERIQLQREVMQNLDETGGGSGIRAECMQLITYHLNNFRVNHAYVLPPSLRPTMVQRSIPHEHAIDGVIFPSVRDRMILLRGRYDLVEAFYGMMSEWAVHGEDPLDHRNWEISERWLKDFAILVNDEVYAITNKWRKQLGKPLYSMPNMQPQVQGAALAPPLP